MHLCKCKAHECREIFDTQFLAAVASTFCATLKIQICSKNKDVKDVVAIFKEERAIFYTTRFAKCRYETI